MKPSIAAKLAQLSNRLEELNHLLATENATADMDQFRRLAREHALHAARSVPGMALALGSDRAPDGALSLLVIGAGAPLVPAAVDGWTLGERLALAAAVARVLHAVAERGLVFQPFYRALGTGVDGTGLGLAIVQEICRSHDAEITIGTAHARPAQPGHGPGALFTIRFPLKRQTAA